MNRTKSNQSETPFPVYAASFARSLEMLTFEKQEAC